MAGPHWKTFGLQRISLVAAILSVSLVVAAAFLVHNKYRADTTRALDTLLSAVLQTTTESLREWFKSHKRQVEIWARSPELIGHVTDLAALSGSKVSLRRAAAQKKIRSTLGNAAAQLNYTGFLVISPEFVNIASSHDGNLGVKSLLAGQDSFWAAIRQGRTVASTPQRSDVPLRDEAGRLVDGYPTMFVATPIFDANNVLPDRLGMGIMRERAEHAGANLRIKSQPGEGTQIIVNWQNMGEERS